MDIISILPAGAFQSSAGHNTPGGERSIAVSLPFVSLLSALAGGVVGGLVYSLCKDDTKLLSESGLNDKYGSPEDFQRAIQELLDTFASQDAVSTDPDDLHLHGYSDNDYHPGAFWSGIGTRLSCRAEHARQALPRA